jgi:hypothetical protein
MLTMVKMTALFPEKMPESSNSLGSSSYAKIIGTIQYVAAFPKEPRYIYISSTFTQNNVENMCQCKH